MFTNVSTQLVRDISETETEFLVHHAGNFVDGQERYARIDNEIIKVTGAEGGGIGRITGERAQLGTIAAAHTTDSPLILLDEIMSNVIGS